MAEPFIASVQYGDLRGTVAIDGHDGAFLHELTKFVDMPSGYWPVGLTIHRLAPSEEGGKIPFSLNAVRCDEAGHDVEEIIEFARTAAEFPIYPFDGLIDPQTLFSMMKRIEIKLLDKTFRAAKNVVEYNTP